MQCLLSTVILMKQFVSRQDYEFYL